MKIDKDLLKRLIDAFGISGNEEDVRNIIRTEIKDYVDEIFVDKIGNLIARRKGNTPKIMLAAHMDEVGLMVKRIDSKGHIYCTALGDVDPAMVLGQTVHIKTEKGKIHGIITIEEVSAGKLVKEMPSIESIYIDTGMSEYQLRAVGVEIGNYLPFEYSSCCFIENGIIFGKALDNRVGCYVLIELAKRIKKAKIKGNPEIDFVFTVQEEVGLRGARPSVFSIKPDWGIVVDITHANDSFPEPSRYIGKGPCLTIKDGEFIGSRSINKWIKDIAKKNNIPLQLEAIELGTTDAAFIQTTGGGVPTSSVLVPARNIHTTVGIAAVSDIEYTILLLEELLKKPPVVCPV
ncbi:MAG: M20/M25/M40 family metallo-hydrolase [Nanoarchaeota archaeon]|nr:M20/M25/M40 family metallo-hydrolase [Nanoarchaeota archaeon]